MTRRTGLAATSRLTLLALAAVLTPALGACGGKSDAPLVIDAGCEGERCRGSLMVRITAPGGIAVDDAVGAPTGALVGPRCGRLRVRAVKASSADEMRTARRDLPDFAMETLPDGFAITYRMDHFSVEVWRNFGERQVLCDASSTTAEEAAAVLAACRSLAPVASAER